MVLRDDRPRDVEFLAVTDTSWQALENDEAARRPEPLGSPGTRRAFAAAVVLVVGGALVLRTVTSHDVQRHATPPTAVVLPAVVQPDVMPGPPSRLPSDLATYGSRTEVIGTVHCPPPPSGCTVSDGLPLVFLYAVQAKLGFIVATQQLDVAAGSGPPTTTWYRQLTATGKGTVRVVVTVSKVGATVSTSGVTQSPNAVTAQVTHPSGTGYLVEIDATGPLGWRPPLAAMTALAADPRLLAPDSP